MNKQTRVQITAINMNHLDECYRGDFLAYKAFWARRRYWGFGPFIPFVRWCAQERAKFFKAVGS